MEKMSVLVTGAGGSIGKEIARQLVYNEDISAILLNDISESALFDVFHSLQNASPVTEHSIRIIPILGDVCSDYTVMEIDTQCENIDMIYHAAAYKHVNLSMRTPAVYS